MRRNLFTIFFLFFLSFCFSQNTDWVLSFGGTDSDKGISIGTDSLGFIYCSGFFNNEATFGSITLTNSPLSTWGNNKEVFVFTFGINNLIFADLKSKLFFFETIPIKIIFLFLFIN